jgi:hypothetical protein
MVWIIYHLQIRIDDGDLAHMVERKFRILEALGSIPKFSIFSIFWLNSVFVYYQALDPIVVKSCKK